MAELRRPLKEPGVWFDPTNPAGQPFDERERQQFLDFQLAHRNTPEFHEKYGGLVVAISRGVVFGSGRTHSDAWAAACARPDCPSREWLTFAVVPEEPALTEST